MSPPRKKPAKTGERAGKKSTRTARAKATTSGSVQAKAAQEKAAVASPDQHEEVRFRPFW